MSNEARPLTIGELARITGLPPKTIRYYEEVGLLPPPRRTPSGYRLYSSMDVRRLGLIRRARLLDMALSEVQELVQWAEEKSCYSFQEGLQGLVRQKLEEVDQRLAELQTLKRELQHLEAHLSARPREEFRQDLTVMQCDPESCPCMKALDIPAAG